MVKLLRFKYDNKGIVGQDVRGFGKQPISIGAYSSIALKNYNIKLVATLEDMVFTVGFDDIINFGFVEEGVAIENIRLPADDYKYDELRLALELNINSLTEQNKENSPKGYSTVVVLQLPESYLLFNTYESSAEQHLLNVLDNFEIVDQGPGEVDINTEGAPGIVYDASASYTRSVAIINNGSYQQPSDIMTGGDTFSFTILTTAAGDEVRFGACDNGDIEQTSLWGIGYTGGEYIYANNSPYEEWNSLPVGGYVPTDGDIMTYVRSGLRMLIKLTRAGTEMFNEFIELSPSVLDDTSEYLYSFTTIGPVVITDLIYAMSHYNIECQTNIQCESSESLANQLGFPSLDIITSGDLADPARISLGVVDGAVSYEGVMVCINGLDLETYDFATKAEGKTNFLYTIQKEPGVEDIALGDITNEPYIDMNNMSAMNINNKLSLYLLDTASNRKLSFTYADLLLIVK